MIDLRAATPLNYAPLVESVRKTGKVLLAQRRGGARQRDADASPSNLTQLCFDDLDAPPVVVGSRNWITPAAELEALFFPQPSWMLDAIHERILPLKGYQPKTNQSPVTGIPVSYTIDGAQWVAVPSRTKVIA